MIKPLTKPKEITKKGYSMEVWCELALLFAQVRRAADHKEEEDVFPPVKLSNTTLDQVKNFMTYLPVIHILCNPGLRQRHWEKVC